MCVQGSRWWRVSRPIRPQRERHQGTPGAPHGVVQGAMQVLTASGPTVPRSSASNSAAGPDEETEGRRSPSGAWPLRLACQLRCAVGAGTRRGAGGGTDRVRQHRRCLAASRPACLGRWWARPATVAAGPRVRPPYGSHRASTRRVGIGQYLVDRRGALLEPVQHDRVPLEPLDPRDGQSAPPTLQLLPSSAAGLLAAIPWSPRRTGQVILRVAMFPPPRSQPISWDRGSYELFSWESGTPGAGATGASAIAGTAASTVAVAGCT